MNVFGQLAIEELRASRPRRVIGLRASTAAPLLGLALTLIGLAAVADGFFDRTTDEARALATAERRWTLVYFPTVRGNVPAQMEGFALPADLADRVVGATVRASEVRELLDEYGVRFLPALVVLDPFGVPQQRFEGSWTAKAFVAKLQLLERALQRSLKELDSLAGQVEEALEAERIGRAIELLAEIVARTSPQQPHRLAADAAVTKLRDRANGELLRALALEGIVSDRKLAASLEDLAQRYRDLPVFDVRIAREMARLKGRKLGGR